MVKKEIISFIFVVLFSNVDAYTSLQKALKGPILRPPGVLCVNATRVTQAQINAARRTEDITLITPCFFSCYLSEFSIIKGRKIDVFAFLLFAKTFVFTINLTNLLPIIKEVLPCALAYDAVTAPDNVSALSCPKTKAFLDCLVPNSPVLKQAIKDAVDFKGFKG